jgi:hypothetical protein
VHDQIAPLDVRQLVQEHVLGVPARELAQVAFRHEQHGRKDPEYGRIGEPLGHSDSRNPAQSQALRAVGQVIVEGLQRSGCRTIPCWSATLCNLRKSQIPRISVPENQMTMA